MLTRYAALVSRVSSVCTFGSNFIRPQILHGTWLLFSRHCRYCGGLARIHDAKYQRVIELNVGTICASLPFLPAFYHHHHLKPSHVAAVRSITNRIRPFRSSRKMRDDHLETGILGSIQGEGKFLRNDELSDLTGSTTTTQLTEK